MRSRLMVLTAAALMVAAVAVVSGVNVSPVVAQEGGGGGGCLQIFGWTCRIRPALARIATGPSVQSGVARLQLVPSTQRAAGLDLVVSAAPDADHLALLFEVDLGPDDFPARLTVTTRGGRSVVQPREIEPEDLFRGAYVIFLCSLRDCPQGDYLAAVQPRDGVRPPTQYPFRIVQAEEPPAR